MSYAIGSSRESNQSRRNCHLRTVPLRHVADNIMHFVRTFSITRAQGVRLIAIEEVQNYGKIVYILNTFKMAGGRMHTPYPTPLDPPLAISYRCFTYFSHLAPLTLLFFTKRQSQKGRGAWHNASLNTLLLATPKRARIALWSLSRNRKINMQIQKIQIVYILKTNWRAILKQIKVCSKGVTKVLLFIVSFNIFAILQWLRNCLRNRFKEQDKLETSHIFILI